MYEYTCIIDRVVDGDTVDVDIHLGFDIVLAKQRVRLYGVDTPESRTSDLVEKKYGKLAAGFVESMLPPGSKQLLISKDYKGKFGRILGDFKIGDSSICQLLIDNHHAAPYHGQSKQEIAETHIKNRELVEWPEG